MRNINKMHESSNAYIANNAYQRNENKLKKKKRRKLKRTYSESEKKTRLAD